MSYPSTQTKPTIGHNQPALTWGCELTQVRRMRDLDKLDGALIGPNSIAHTLGQTSTDYAEVIGRLRQRIHDERDRLQRELDQGAAA